MNMYKIATSTNYTEKGLIVTVVLLLLGSGIIGLFSIQNSSERLSLSQAPAPAPAPVSEEIVSTELLSEEVPIVPIHVPFDRPEYIPLLRNYPGSDTMRPAKISAIQAYPDHSPIVVANNTDFNTTEWSGSGINGDPYIFENYSITSPIGDFGLAISNTDAYFIIRNVELSGSSIPGFGALHLDNVTHGFLTNITVTNGYYGFLLDSSSNNTLSNNNATSNSWSGFSLVSSSNNTLSNNTATSNTQLGFELWSSSSNNTLSNNTATTNAEGFLLRSSSNNNVLSNNTANSNVFGFQLTSGSSNNVLSNNIATSNTLDGFRLFSSSSNTLNNNIATSSISGSGFLLDSSSNFNTLSQNTATSNTLNGFYVLSSSNNNVLNNNTATSNTQSGFYLLSSSNNTLSNNIASNNTLSGFYVLDANNNTFQFNFAFANQLGVFLDGSSQGNSMVDNGMLQNSIFHAADNASGINFWYRNSYGDYMGEPSNTDTYTINGTAGSIDINPIAIDTDMDSLPDWYELLHGLDEMINDAFLDPDNDGYTNLEEFHLGTNPQVSDAVPPSTTTSISTTTLPASTTTTTETKTEAGSLTTTTVTTQGTETITKTAEGFGLVLLGLSFVAFVVSRRKK